MKLWAYFSPKIGANPRNNPRIQELRLPPILIALPRVEKPKRACSKETCNTSAGFSRCFSLQGPRGLI